MIPLGPRVEFLYRQQALDTEPGLVDRYEQSGQPDLVMTTFMQGMGT